MGGINCSDLAYSTHDQSIKPIVLCFTPQLTYSYAFLSFVES